MKYIACICEGSAERAIMDLLLDNHMLRTLNLVKHINIRLI